MIPVYAVAFEFLIVILFGAFFRLDTSTLTNASSFTGNLTFLFGFSLLGVSRKTLSWSSLGNLLILFGICLQWNLLWSVFFNSCFNGFTTQYRLTISDLIQSSQCILCLILVATDLIGKVYYSQLVYISLILSVGFSLNSAVFTYGMKIYDGGCGMQVFLFSAVFSLIAWVVGMRMKNLAISKQESTYQSQTLGLVGMLLVVYGWGSWNMAGAIFTQKNTIVTVGELQTAALQNTVFGMASAVLGSMLLMTPHSKANIGHYIQAIIDGGIIISSITDILLYPVAPIVLSGLASFTTIILFKYYSQSYMLTFFPQSTLRLVFGFLSGVFASIATAARSTQTPTLADNLTTTAPMELAGIAVTVGIAAVFGAGSGLILVFVAGPTHSEIQQDMTSWEIHSEEAKPIVQQAWEDTPRLADSLMAKHKLDVPPKAGTILKRNQSVSERFPNSGRDDAFDHYSHKKPEGTIIRQANHQPEPELPPPKPRKTSDFAIRPTNFSILHPATLNIRDLESVSVGNRPVGRQLDFDSGPSDIGQQTHANQIN